MRSVSFLILLALSLAAPASANDMQCAKDLAVTTPDAARSIYLRELEQRGRVISPGNDVVVKDEGDHWAVYQYPRHIPEPKDNGDGTQTITVVMGGGGLEVEIDKCTGATHAHYSR